MKTMKLLSPNGHLGFAPLRPESFERGLDEAPDIIAADSGSSDIGPAPLALDYSTSPLEWQRADLEHMLLAARRLKVPMIIGSSGDSGSNSRVDLYVRLIKEIADEHGLEPFRIGYFYSEIPVAELRGRLEAGVVMAGLDGRSQLTLDDLDRTDRVVAVAGVHPFVKLLDEGADVIIGGRSSDSAIFAAPAIRAGFAEASSYHLGKLLECASFCAEPYGGKESVLGTISAEDIRVAAMHPEQRCTVASVSSHAMYERPNPFSEFVLGGHLDMSRCLYEQADVRTTRITGAVFDKAEQLTVKLEGAGRVGERFIGFAGIRDPYTIAHIDEVIDWSRNEVTQAFGDDGYSLFYHRYGIDGVMGQWEPTPVAGHEVGLVVEAVAPTAAKAEQVCMTATRQLFYARLPEVKGTAGSTAFLFDEVIQARAACAWTIDHIMPVDDPLELFPTHITQAGISPQASEVKAGVR
ncbi:MAG: acyclic terpene utilization AtuA family protein [Actinomycetota bacterium]|nr:acyclic terpene utilization AtuA family protein [Actinomycetota bacterium]